MLLNHKILLFFLFLFGIAPAQERSRFNGKVSNAFGVVVNGTVLNLNSKTRFPISDMGYFELKAKPKDTLVISSLACLPKTIILHSANFDPPYIEVILEMFDNELKEVIVLNAKEIRPIDANTQKIVDRKYFDDTQSSPINPLMPASPIPNGMDFVRLFKGLKKAIQKNKNDVEQKQQPINFYKEVINKVPTSFFVNTLQIKATEVLLFLSFCQNDQHANEILKENNEFLLYDFLVTKNKDFKSLSTFEK
ncbi:MAG: hypothetical protein ACRC6O_04645 [Flavobacterium sp.]